MEEQKHHVSRGIRYEGTWYVLQTTWCTYRHEAILILTEGQKHHVSLGIRYQGTWYVLQTTWYTYRHEVLGDWFRIEPETFSCYIIKRILGDIPLDLNLSGRCAYAVYLPRKRQHC